MSRAMSRNTMRCLEIAFLVTLLNLLLSFTVVQWYSADSSSQEASLSQDSRLLLSVEYQDSPHTNPLSTPSASSEATAPAADIKSSPDVRPTKTGDGQVTANNNIPAAATSDAITLDLSRGVWDKFRMFRSHMFTVTGDSWTQLSSSRLLCLGAQTSVDRLYELTELVTNWSGPMSIAVFVPDIELGIALRYIQYLRGCHPAIRSQVSFHLIYPRDHPGVREVALDEVVGSLDCKQPKQVLQFMLDTREKDMMTWRTSYSYPQNLLRNLAKAGCQTNYTYIPDIDMVPTPGMDLRLETFLAKDQELGNCTKCAFVIPTYEISTEAGRLPANKTELVSYISDKKARQFHQAVYSINQKSSDLKRWEKIPETDTIQTAYKIEKYIFKYEPLYVARGDTPPFDERFIGFGMTRNTQVYEMYVAGYSFHLLNNAFTSHWGFQSYSTRPVWRAKQMEENNGKFDEFAKELSAHYNADPYDMLSKLKKMNLKHVKVASKITKTSGNDKTKDKS